MSDLHSFGRRRLWNWDAFSTFGTLQLPRETGTLVKESPALPSSLLDDSTANRLSLPGHLPPDLFRSFGNSPAPNASMAAGSLCRSRNEPRRLRPGGGSPRSFLARAAPSLRRCLLPSVPSPSASFRHLAVCSRRDVPGTGRRPNQSGRLFLKKLNFDANGDVRGGRSELEPGAASADAPPHRSRSERPFRNRGLFTILMKEDGEVQQDDWLLSACEPINAGDPAPQRNR